MGRSCCCPGSSTSGAAEDIVSRNTNNPHCAQEQWGGRGAEAEEEVSGSAAGRESCNGGRRGDSGEWREGNAAVPLDSFGECN